MSGNQRRVRFAPALLAAGVLSTAVLGVTTGGTLSGFVGTLTNSTGTAATGTLVLQQQNSARSTTCTSADGANGVSTNTASCSFNLLGGSTTLIPGGTSTTTVYLKNIGTVAAGSFTLLPTAGAGGCTQSANGSRSGSGSLCSQMLVRVYRAASATGTPVFSGSASALGAATASSFTSFPSAPAAGEEIPFTFVVEVPQSSDNTFQGLAVSLPLTWSIAA